MRIKLLLALLVCFMLIKSGASNAGMSGGGNTFSSSLTLENGEQVVNSTDDQVDIKDDDGTTYATFDSSGVTTAGSNERITYSTSGEFIDGGTDDMIEFQGVGGTDDTDLRIDLDGTHPVLDSPTDTKIEFSETVRIQSIDYPSSDGTADEAMVTDGSGTLSFAKREQQICVSAINNAGSSSFCDLGSVCSGTNAEQDQLSPVTTSGTFKNMYAKVINAPGAGESWTFTLKKNDSGSALACSISETDTTCNDTSDSVSVVAGDRIGFTIVPSASPANGTSEGLCVSFIPD